MTLFLRWKIGPKKLFITQVYDVNILVNMTYSEKPFVFTHENPYIIYFYDFTLAIIYLCGQGDLGAIDDKYDIAISTACGALDNIVVDKISTAMNCVDFLKANKLGSSTFIGLDKMEKWKSYCTKKITT